MRELNVTLQWGATYAVAGAAWVVDAYAGMFLIDAKGTQFLIVKNTASVLYLATQRKPIIGSAFTFAAFTGKTPGEYINMNNRTGIILASVIIDSAGTKFPIFNNTADTIVLDTGSSPVAPVELWQGEQLAIELGTASGSAVSWWQIINSSGTVQRTSVQDAGAVTATEGSDSISVTRGARSLVLDTNGIDMWSLTTLVTSPSSPDTVLTAYVHNEPFRGQGSNAMYKDGVGPDPTDAGWTVCPISVNGAAVANSATINSGTPRLIVPSMHPNDALFRARWLMFDLAPAGSPGTGTFSARLDGTGPW